MPQQSELSALYAAEEENETDAAREARMTKEVEVLPKIYALARLMQGVRGDKGVDSNESSSSKKE